MGGKATSGVKASGNRIEIRFMYQGKQRAPTLDLKPTAANIKHASRQREEILNKISNGNFSFADYFPDYKYSEVLQPASEAESRTFREWVVVWEGMVSRELEWSTLNGYKKHLQSYWQPAFDDMRPAAITHEKILLHLAYLATARVENGKVRKALTRKTQNNVLIPFRGVLAKVCKALKITNPCDGIENLKVQTGDPDPFDAQELELVLAKLRQQAGDEWADYFEFAFFAGLRVSEQIALQWTNVDLRKSVIGVRQVTVRGHKKSRTKTHYSREVELNDRAVAVLNRQRARTQMAGMEVFVNPNNRVAINTSDLTAKIWTRAIRSTGVRYRPQKETRDTSVTMALMAGADPYWVATMHGHSLQTMLKDYAKWIPNADRGRNLARVNEAITPPIGGTTLEAI